MMAAGVAVVDGIANQRAPLASVHFATPLFYVGCAFFLLSAAGTIALLRVAAVAFAAPLVLAGIWSVGAVLVRASWAAVVGNVLITLPLLCSPAFVIYRNWRCLR
jgi:hypothetical protein